MGITFGHHPKTQRRGFKICLKAKKSLQSMSFTLSLFILCMRAMKLRALKEEHPTRYNSSFFPLFFSKIFFIQIIRPNAYATDEQLQELKERIIPGLPTRRDRVRVKSLLVELEDLYHGHYSLHCGCVYGKTWLASKTGYRGRSLMEKVRRRSFAQFVSQHTVQFDSILK